MNYAARSSQLQFACISNRVIWRRGYASVQREAYLEPFSSHPGVVALRLNRPQAKNAISVNLLKVSSAPMIKVCTKEREQQFHECLLNVREAKRFGLFCTCWPK